MSIKIIRFILFLIKFIPVLIITWKKIQFSLYEILIEIETKLADSEKSGSKCGDAYLGKIPPGEYVVFYSSGGNKKVLLGHVTALL